MARWPTSSELQSDLFENQCREARYDLAANLHPCYMLLILQGLTDDSP